ncbi:MAG: flagellar biosynthetic protein FliR [Ardenticatenales bacterium]
MNGFAAAAGFALLLVRPGMIVMGTPFLGALNAPPQVRVGLIAFLAILMAAATPTPVTLPAAGLAIVIVREMAIGMAIALSARVLISGAEFAGQFAGYQIGLSLGALIDPQSGVRNNVLALLYGNLAVVICFATNAHHAVLRALGDSYTMLPLGLGNGIGPSLGTSVGHILGMIFLLGMRIAAPLIVVLLLVELALGLVARVAPSLNVMIAGAPVRVVAGLLVIALTVSGLPTLITRFLPAVLSLSAETVRAFR